MLKCKRGTVLVISADLDTITNTSCRQCSVICAHSITVDLCPRRPLHAEFRGMSFWLKLGHTSSREFLLAKAPFMPAAVACLFGRAKEFALGRSRPMCEDVV